MSLVTQFLTNIRGFVKQQNGAKLRDWLQVDGNAGSQYFALAQELRSGFPGTSKALDNMVERCLPIDDDAPEGQGSVWPGFVSFMKEYLQYWRDVDFDQLLSLHELLSALLT